PEFTYNKKTHRLETTYEDVFVKCLSYRPEEITFLLNWGKREIVFRTVRNIFQGDKYYALEWEITTLSTIEVGRKQYVFNDPAERKRATELMLASLRNYNGSSDTGNFKVLSVN